MPNLFATARAVSTAAVPASPPVPGSLPDAAPGAAIDRLKARLPEHARDLRINLGVIAGATALTPQQAWGTALTAALTARQAYLSVMNGIAQVGALEQARVSSESALQSNKLGYEVGVRINIDVLNAQQQLYSTERDLAVARYNTITNQLRLKAAAGSLTDQDLEEVNRALAP